jgi:tetratricopeptide (TPR) repeat protein
MRCLDHRLAELDTSAKLLAATTEPAGLDKEMAAAMALEPLAPCADVATLERAVPLPDEPARRATAEAIAREVDAIEAERRAGRLKGLRARIDPVVARARALDHAPTLAIALASLGEIELGDGEIAAATVTYHQLADAAARARDDARETMAWASLITSLGVDLGKPDEARALIPVARAALARAGDRVELRITVLHAEAGFLDAHGEGAAARARLDEARGLIEKQGALEPGSPLMPRLADLWLEIGDARRDDDPDGAAAAYRHAIELWGRAYGPSHAEVAWGWHDLGTLLADQGKLDDALAAIRKAIAIREARLGDTPQLAISLAAEATTLYYAERYEQALASARRALAIYERSADPDSLQAVGVRLTIAMTDTALGREPQARAGYDAIVARFDRTGAKTANLIVALFRRGEQAAKLDNCADAVLDYERAERVAVELEGDRTDKLVYPLVGHGACLIRLHHPVEAASILRRAIALGPAPSEAALARFLLGRALVESHADVAGGLAMARAAHKDMNARDPEFKQSTAEARAWLEQN